MPLAHLRVIPAASPEPAAPTHVTIPPAARNAYVELKASLGALDRVFSGSFATATAYAEVGRLADEVRSAAERVKRFSR